MAAWMVKMVTRRGIAVKLCERFRSFSNSCLYDRKNFSKQYKDHVMNTDTPPLLVNYGDGLVQMLTCSTLHKFTGRQPLISVQFPSNFIVCGPCHGLFCLYTVEGEVALWNPATGDIHNLPADLPQGEIKVHNVGFGFDSSVNDYKIVRYIARRCCRNNKYNFNFEDEKIIHEMQICSLKSKQWREIAVEGEITSCLPSLSPGSYADGACYWSIHNHPDHKTRLIYFVFAEEEFHLECLSGVVPYETISCLMDTFNGLPAAIVYPPPANFRSHEDPYIFIESMDCYPDIFTELVKDYSAFGQDHYQYFHVWLLMRDNGVLTWVHRMEIGPISTMGHYYTPLYMWRNKGLIMFDSTYHLFWYDFDTKNVIRTHHSLHGKIQRRKRSREKSISLIQVLNFPEILVFNPW